MTMIDSFLLALEQWFFLRSLLVVLLLALVFPLYGNLVVVRKEANIAHTFSHMWLLWVAVWLWFDRPIELTILWSVLTTVLFLHIVWSKDSQDHVVHNEIGAQFGLVGAILLVSLMSGYKADITSYLFGDILLLGSQDVYIILWIVVLCLSLYALFWRTWFALSLDLSLARSKNISPTFSTFMYLLALGLLIGGAMKIVWVLLVSAFLILPSNTSKLMATNSMQWNILAVFICASLSVISLFLSRYRDAPSWATIIALMIICYLAAKLYVRWRR